MQPDEQEKLRRMLEIQANEARKATAEAQLMRQVKEKELVQQKEIALQAKRQADAAAIVAAETAKQTAWMKLTPEEQATARNAESVIKNLAETKKLQRIEREKKDRVDLAERDADYLRRGKIFLSKLKINIVLFFIPSWIFGLLIFFFGYYVVGLCVLGILAVLIYELGCIWDGISAGNDPTSFWYHRTADGMTAVLTFSYVILTVAALILNWWF